MNNLENFVEGGDVELSFDVVAPDGLEGIGFVAELRGFGALDVYDVTATLTTDTLTLSVVDGHTLAAGRYVLVLTEINTANNRPIEETSFSLTILPRL